MKTSRMWAAMGCLLASLTTGNAEAQNTRFILVNNTEFTVYSVFIWPASRTREGPDRLGNNMIASGESRQFKPEDGTCVYNIRVTLVGDSDEFRQDRVDLCSLNKLTLYYNYQEDDLIASTE